MYTPLKKSKIHRTIKVAPKRMMGIYLTYSFYCVWLNSVLNFASLSYIEQVTRAFLSCHMSCHVKTCHVINMPIQCRWREWITWSSDLSGWWHKQTNKQTNNKKDIKIVTTRRRKKSNMLCPILAVKFQKKKPE